MLSSLLPNRNRKVCPYCAEPHDFSKKAECPTTNQIIPKAFIANYDTIRPLWLHAVGFPDHGKTVYFSVLIELLENLPEVWEGFSWRYLNQHTLSTVQNNRERLLLKHEMPDKTVVTFPVPALVQLNQLRLWKPRCMVIHDTGGESYENMDIAPESAGFIRRARTSFFIVSLPDLVDSPTRSIADLFDVYEAAMEEHNAPLANRNLVVVFTKADEITNFGSNFQDLKDYIQQDDWWERIKQKRMLSLEERRQYNHKLAYISDRLYEFTLQNVNKGKGFIGKALNDELTGRPKISNLKFAIVSALGHAPNKQTKKLEYDIHPCRIQDPLLWALLLEPSPS